MNLIYLIRLIALGVVLLLSIIVLGLSANLDASFATDFTPASLALAVAILSLVTIVPVVTIEFVRKGAFTSLVFVELIWVGILWVLWLAAGAEAASLNIPASLCGNSFLDQTAKTNCSSILAIEAFSFLNWIILAGWFGTLLVFSILGNHWHSSVADADLLKKNMSAGASTGPVTYQQPNMAAAPGAQYGNYPQQSYQSSPYPQPAQQAYPPSPMGGQGQLSSPSPGSVPV